MLTSLNCFVFNSTIQANININQNQTLVTIHGISLFIFVYEYVSRFIDKYGDICACLNKSDDYNCLITDVNAFVCTNNHSLIFADAMPL